jgi:glycosyltransferase involved in cell wall biosynthesis
MKFNDSCGSCPSLNSQIQNDLSRETWKRKYSAWRNVQLTLIAPSRWLSRLTASSSLFRDQRVEVIPNCIDIDVFQPCDQSAARQALSLSPNRQVLLFSALTADGDQRKGFHFLQPALERLAKNVERDSITLAVMGMMAPTGGPMFPFPIQPLGILREDRKVALAYAAADVFLAPSMEDNLPNTVMEALSCGTPCVAFNIGGMSDMIDHQKNGYLADAFDEDDLAMGIRWVLADENRRRSLGDAARKKVVAEYGFEPIARRHVRLYEELTLTTKRSEGVEIC